MKTETVIIQAPKCFGNEDKNNKSCESCIFLFDCLEKKADKKGE